MNGKMDVFGGQRPKYTRAKAIAFAQQGVVNDMHNIIDKAQDAFKSTENNLNEFSRQIRNQ